MARRCLGIALLILLNARTGSPLATLRRRAVLRRGLARSTAAAVLLVGPAQAARAEAAVVTADTAALDDVVGLLQTFEDSLLGYTLGFPAGWKQTAPLPPPLPPPTNLIGPRFAAFDFGTGALIKVNVERACAAAPAAAGGGACDMVQTIARRGAAPPAADGAPPPPPPSEWDRLGGAVAAARGLVARRDEFLSAGLPLASPTNVRERTVSATVGASGGARAFSRLEFDATSLFQVGRSLQEMIWDLRESQHKGSEPRRRNKGHFFSRGRET